MKNKWSSVQTLQFFLKIHSPPWEWILGAMVEVYLNQKDPVRKAKRQKLKGTLQKVIIPQFWGTVNKVGRESDHSHLPPFPTHRAQLRQ